VNVRWGRIAAFFASTVILTQATSAMVAALRGPARPGDMFEWAVRANLAMLVPGIVALVFARLVLVEPVAVALDLRLRPNRWWLVAWLLPVAAACASAGLRLLAPGAHVATSQLGQLGHLPLPPFPAALVAGLVAGATVCLPGGLGEELAWRGLLRRELAAIGFGRSCLVIALLWAAWHMPAVIFGGYAGGTVAGALGLTLQILLTTPVTMVLCERGRSVVPAALFHASADGMVAVGMAVQGAGGAAALAGRYLPAVIMGGLALGLRRR
jgi:hypothetical protein